jgi:hypothetical protein
VVDADYSVSAWEQDGSEVHFALRHAQATGKRRPYDFVVFCAGLCQP